MKLSSLLFLVILSSCSFKKNLLENQTQSGHSELYSEPESPSSGSKEGFSRVIIAATNDIQGHYRPNKIIFKDRQQEGQQSINVGGVNYISSYFQILRKHYGNVLLLDSGDLFSSKSQEVNFISDFYSELDYDAVTVGLDDFNIKLPSKFKSSSDFIKDFSAKSKTPLILSNLYEVKTARAVEWTGTFPYLIREVNGVKVGILGLIPDDVVELTPIDNRIGLYVDSMLESTLRQSRLLRSLGAEIIVVLTHQGLTCGEELAQELKIPLSKVNFEPEKKGICDLASKMGEYLNRLPPGLVDLVIGGRTENKTANFINNTLVINSFNNGLSFSYAELFVNTKTRKLQKEKTVVHQPVMFCQEFFKETNDCYTEDSSVDHKVRTSAEFLGKIIEPDTNLMQKFHYYLNDKSNTSSIRSKNIQSIVDFHGGDISYSSTGLGVAKLVLISLRGADIINILEDDYNQGLESNWRPSPFSLNQSNLSLSIQGSSIENDKYYSVLVDLGEAQRHIALKKFISQSSTKSLNTVSWNEPGIEKDAVSTTMSSSQTVR